jgi:putative membrane protein
MEGFLNFCAYFGACIAFWALSISIYVRITPYREFELIRQGNMAAAFSLSGAALGMAMPLVSLAAHAVSVVDLAMWAVVALLAQLALWLVLSRTLFPGMKAAVQEDKRSVGMMMGAMSICIGAMNAGSLTY